MSALQRVRAVRLRAEHGFTMIVAIGVMFVTGLLLVAAFTIAIGEVEASHNDLARKQAYYAALAGVQEYEYELQTNPDYWEKCAGPSGTVVNSTSERYEDEVLLAKTAPKEKYSKCTAASPFESAIESKGGLTNTFRIKATGYAAGAKRTLIATFKVTGFLDYVYFTNYEVEDPELYKQPEGKCVGEYYTEWHPAGAKCAVIVFTSGDEVKGPMHTNDAAKVEGTARFGRSSEERKEAPPDAIEINKGTYPEDENEKCAGLPTFNTESKCYTMKGENLQVPPDDTSLTAYVKSAYEYSGQTRIVLNGESNTMNVTTWNGKGELEEKKGVALPENGLIYVKSSGACGFPYTPWNSDTAEEVTERKGCGDVYVSGSYSESLTIAAENNVIITGNLYPTSLEDELGASPSGTAVLGLIATDFVRIYHPVQTGGGAAERTAKAAATRATSARRATPTNGAASKTRTSTRRSSPPRTRSSSTTTTAAPRSAT